ncbi:MAG TPA: LON peptidase substrate-binding domain-containing protein [Gemmatimonadales bacterium]|nr:LON peptidase substrate-binding domain-containing protein [Gemmatimonadales bacterium]
MPPYPLPLFPVEVVLFPGAPLPLHIFEPRYRQMLADCLTGESRFGIVGPGRETEAPDAGAVGCAAEIQANDPLPDGRSNILVVGGARFVVRRLLDDPAPYHVGLVEEFEERPGTLPAAEPVSEVRDLFARYHRMYRSLQDAEAEAPDLPDDPVPLSFMISAALDCDLGIKRRLLALRATDDRVALLVRLIPTLMRALESSLRVHQRARRNGKGNAHSVLPAES